MRKTLRFIALFSFIIIIIIIIIIICFFRPYSDALMDSMDRKMYDEGTMAIVEGSLTPFRLRS